MPHYTERVYNTYSILFPSFSLLFCSFFFPFIFLFDRMPIMKWCVRAGGRIGTVAVTPASEDVPVEKFAKLLATALKQSEGSVLHLTKENVKSLTGAHNDGCILETSSPLF